MTPGIVAVKPLRAAMPPAKFRDAPSPNVRSQRRTPSDRKSASGLWRSMHTGALAAYVAHERYAALRRAPVEVTPAGRLLERALMLAIELDHPIYDGVCLALARGAQMVSADRRFVSAARRHAALADSIVLLAETAH
jgi:hypothetical protein